MTKFDIYKNYTEKVFDEVNRAQKKFPNQNLNITYIALCEEVGELAKAILEKSNIKEEAIQVACMSFRILLEH